MPANHRTQFGWPYRTVPVKNPGSEVVRAWAVIGRGTRTDFLQLGDAEDECDRLNKKWVETDEQERVS